MYLFSNGSYKTKGNKTQNLNFSDTYSLLTDISRKLVGLILNKLHFPNHRFKTNGRFHFTLLICWCRMRNKIMVLPLNFQNLNAYLTYIWSHNSKRNYKFFINAWKIFFDLKVRIDLNRFLKPNWKLNFSNFPIFGRKGKSKCPKMLFLVHKCA